MTQPVRITDLVSPTYTDEVLTMREAILPMARACSLDSDALHRQAMTETGLSDFGPQDYRERLDVLLAAYRDIDMMTELGVFGTYTQLLQLLKNRLRLVDLLAREPQIHEIELLPPVIIVGLPRTGTTHLHNLLAAAPTFRSLPYWESVEPFPAAGVADTEERRQQTEMTLWFMNQAMPLFPLMHEMTTDHVHEEIGLLAIDFSTMFFETIAAAPRWQTYYRSHDQTPHYEYLRVTLQALQHLRGGKRWVLKSPQHLEQLPVLTSVFPDATIVVTHRDPVDVTVSMATMIAYTARGYLDVVDAQALGRAWADRIETLLAACVRDRDRLDPQRSMDLRFDDFMRDDLAAVGAVYSLCGEPLTPDTLRAMSDYMVAHPRGRLGRIDYRAADVGLDPDELRERFAAYTKRFLGEETTPA